MRYKNAKAICKHCGNEFETFTWEIARGNGIFCSRSCAAKFKFKSIAGEQFGNKNPNWRGGISKNNYHYKKLYRDRHPRRKKAHVEFYRAKRNGSIIQEPCSVCGNPNSHGHHDDYDKPLDVRWLCREHHDEWHRFNKVK